MIRLSPKASKICVIKEDMPNVSKIQMGSYQDDPGATLSCSLASTQMDTVTSHVLSRP